jgi:methionyl-tRNA synthetase
LNFLESNELEDLSISRPKSQLEWGVEVPDDDTHVMYVWFDALSNYITGVGYPDGDEFHKWWPADLHIIGKDINRFHSVYWPIMLMSAGVELPKSLYVHGFINAPGGVKMSKSLGNAVEPTEIIERYGTDALRYYLLRYIPHDGDGEFGLDRFHAVYSSDLVNNLGNLVQRVASMCVKYADGKFEPHNSVSLTSDIDLTDVDFDGVLQKIWQKLDRLNEDIDRQEPWRLAKTDLLATKKLLQQWIGEISQIASQIQPFMPETSIKISDTFSGGRVDMHGGILFPRIERDN